MINQNRLGSMGEPVKLTLEGQPVFVCCAGLRARGAGEPRGDAGQIRQRLEQARPEPAEPIAAPKPTRQASGQHKDGQDHRRAGQAVRGRSRAGPTAEILCGLPTSRLGSMGPPVKVLVDGQPVFVCCEGCREDALAIPQATLDDVRELPSEAPIKTNDGSS